MTSFLTTAGMERSSGLVWLFSENADVKCQRLPRRGEVCPPKRIPEPVRALLALSFPGFRTATEPLRQGGTQHTLIWEESDFSSKLWAITTLLRMTLFPP